MGETPDKVAALMALAAIGAPHALVGGVAVGVHSGVPRATADTDIAGFLKAMQFTPAAVTALEKRL